MDRVEHLLSSCLENNVVAVSSLISSGYSVNEQDIEGTAPLHIAAANGYETLIEILLSHGADVDLADSYGWTALMQAARHGHASAVSHLLAYDANVNAVNKLGIGVLSLAASSGHTHTVQLILNARRALPEAQTWDMCEMTPVMAAALYGRLSVIGLLLQRGASVNSVSPATGRSPLMLSACNGHESCVQFLVEWGADTNWKDTQERTALDIALACGRTDTAAYLSQRTLTQSSNGQCQSDIDIIEAVKGGNLKWVKAILDEDSSRGSWCCPGDGTTPLMYAASLGYIDIAALLLKSQAEINAQDNRNGWTALMHAVYHGQTRMVSYLLETGSNISITALNGSTVLDLACYLDSIDPKILEILKEKTALIARTAAPFHMATDGNASESKRMSEDDGQTKRLKGWIGHVTQKLSQLKTKQRALKVTSGTAPDITYTASGLLSFDTISKLEGKPALSILQRMPETSSNQPDEITPPLSLLDSTKTTKNASMPGKLSRRTGARNLPFPRRVRQYTAMLQPVLKPVATSEAEAKRISKQLGLLPVSAAGAFAAKLGVRDSSRQKEFLSVPSLWNASPPLDDHGNGHCFSGTIRDLLKMLNLEHYAANFKEHEVDLDVFVDLNATDLTNIGIPSNTSKEKLLRVIKLMRDLIL